MYAALHVPSFRLAALHRCDPAPAALLNSADQDKATITEVNHSAQRHRLFPGLKSTQALSRCPDLRFYPPDPKAEARAARELLDFTDSLVPHFEVTSPGTHLLDLASLGAHDLFNSSTEEPKADPVWIRDTLRFARDLDLPFQLALGPTPDQAHLAALCDQTALTFEKCDFLPTDTTFSTPIPLSLPLTALLHTGFACPDHTILHLWGVHTLGDLKKLPHQGLTERLGADTAHLHQILTGKHHRLLTLRQPTEHYQKLHHFEPPLDSLEPLIFIAKRLLQSLLHHLASNQRAARALDLHLAFDNGSAHARLLTLPQPTLQLDDLLRALSTHLDTCKAPAPVISLHLTLQPTAHQHAQHQLFQKGLRDPNQFADTLQRIASLLGGQQLGIPQPAETHDPDGYLLHSLSPDLAPIPLSDTRPPGNVPLAAQRPPLPIQVETRPSTRLSQPHPIPIRILTGPCQGPITARRGPFLLGSRWWEPSPISRLQWDVEVDHRMLSQLTFSPPQTWLTTGYF